MVGRPENGRIRRGGRDYRRGGVHDGDRRAAEARGIFLVDRKEIDTGLTQPVGTRWRLLQRHEVVVRIVGAAVHRDRCLAGLGIGLHRHVPADGCRSVVRGFGLAGGGASVAVDVVSVVAGFVR